MCVCVCVCVCVSVTEIRRLKKKIFNGTNKTEDYRRLQWAIANGDLPTNQGQGHISVVPRSV